LDQKLLKGSNPKLGKEEKQRRKEGVFGEVKEEFTK